MRLRRAGTFIKPSKVIGGKMWGLKATPGESLAYSPRNTDKLVITDFSKLALAGNYQNEQFQFKVTETLEKPTLFNMTNQTANFTHISISDRKIIDKIDKFAPSNLTILTGSQTKATVSVIAEVNNTRTFNMFLKDGNFTLVTVIPDKVIDFSIDKSPEPPHSWESASSTQSSDFEDLLNPANSERFVTVFATQEKMNKVYLKRVTSQFDGQKLLK